MSSISRAEILKLSVSERILWSRISEDSIAEAPEEIALSKPRAGARRSSRCISHESDRKGPHGQ